MLVNLPNLMVILRSNSFLKRTVCTPEMALTTVDLPCATWPIVPILMVACREITSGESADNFEMSCNGQMNNNYNTYFIYVVRK